VLLWIILAVLTASVLFVLLRPLAGKVDGAPGREAFNATVYRDQLEEIEADYARGLIGDADAEAARAEVGRRLLAADAASNKENAGARARLARIAIVSVALMLPLLVLGLYLVYGSPQLPDQPLAARLTDPASETSIGALVARVEARLRAHPEEGEGWDAIAPIYLGARRYADAADAYSQAIRLLGPSPQRLSGYGQALVLEKGGIVGEDARRALTQAVALDETLVEPRILLAVAKEQDGDFQGALESWKMLVGLKQGDDHWRTMIQKRIEAAEAHLNGTPPVARDLPDRAQPGPSSADVAAARDMTAADRQAMIEGMVQRLAARLESQGDDLTGWLRLVRAYTVLGRTDDARQALARAKTQFAGNTQAIDQLDALAAELGLKS
jgi:cytochrome c-type biogenesis protein CcmH